MPDMEADLIGQYHQQFSGGPYWLGIAIGPGWMPIVAQACQEIQDALDMDDLQRFHWLQIKEKWGELTMYWGPRNRVVISAVSPGSIVEFETDKENTAGDMESDLSPATRAHITAIVTHARERASRTCEYCGATGTKRQWPCVAVMCDACTQRTGCRHGQ